MASFNTDLFERLINHRVSDERARREDYLTECLAWVLENDRPLLKAFLAAEGLVFRDKPHRAPDDAVRLDLKTQDRLSPRDRPDLAIRGEGFLLLVECKVDAPFDHWQIGRYLGHVAALDRGGVVAVLPRRAVPGSATLSAHDRFLGFVAWEEVAVLLERLAPTGDGRDDFRAGLYRLLTSYGLVPLEGRVAPWEHDDGSQDVDEVLRICDAFDRAAGEVAADASLMARAPYPYRGNGAGALQTYRVNAGSGGSPRPIVLHATVLRAEIQRRSSYKYSTFLDAVVNVTFQLPTNDVRDLDVEFVVDVRPVWFADDAALVRAILSAGPWTVSAEESLLWATRAVRDLHQGYEDVVRRVAHQLAHVYPEAHVEQWGNSGLRLVVAPTESWVAPGQDYTGLQARQAALLRNVLEAFFDAEPDKPIGRLLTTAVCESQYSRPATTE